jgi:N-acetylneuraminic acid mutarotase
MERYDIDKDRWLELKTELNEGRYHSTACMLNNRFIYVFGGFKTTHFTQSKITRVLRKFESMDNVSMNVIEKYDTWKDQEDENWAKMSKI